MCERGKRKGGQEKEGERQGKDGGSLRVSANLVGASWSGPTEGQGIMHQHHTVAGPLSSGMDLQWMGGWAGSIDT